MKALRNSKAGTTSSAILFLLFIERLFLDFRYVSLEMEAVDAILPFTAPYMAVAFVILGLWLWALLSAIRDRRTAFLPLLGFNLLGLIFGLATVLILCPTPCSTGAPLADVLDWAMVLIGAGSALSAGLTYVDLGGQVTAGAG